MERVGVMSGKLAQFASNWTGRLFAGLMAVCTAAAVLVLLPTVGAASDVTSDYRLGPQDKIRLSVYEWRASRDEVYEWKALNTEYVVNGSGRVSIPLIGEVPATGKTTAVLAQEIGEKLRERMGFVTAPDIAVEVAQFRPFYVTGDVEKPGEYSYRPGLTVLQAVTIAGGPLRGPAQGQARLEREAITARGELQLYSNEATALLARIARLTAEMRESESIDFPAALRDMQTDTSVSTVLVQEELIHETKQRAFDNQVSALEKLRDYLAKEVTSITSQIEVHDKQVESMRKELGDVKSLVAKGLSTVARQGLLERAEAQLMGDQLRLESNLMKARQEMGRVDVSILELRSKRSTETTTELRAAQQRLEELGQRMSTTAKLLYESEVIAPRFVRVAGNNEAQPIYTIIRAQDGLSLELAATHSMLVQPGDTVKLDLPAPRAGGLTIQQAKDPALPKSDSHQPQRPRAAELRSK